MEFVQVVLDAMDELYVRSVQVVAWSDENFEYVTCPDTAEQVWQVEMVLLLRTTFKKRKNSLYISDNKYMFTVPSKEEAPFR